MPNIIDTLDEFVESLENNTLIECDQHGRWHHEGVLHKINHLITLNDKNQKHHKGTFHKISRLLTLNIYHKDPELLMAKGFAKTLENIEKIPVMFNDLKSSQAQYKKFMQCIKAYFLLEKKFHQSSNPEVKNELNLIKQRIIGLKYRIEAIHGGIDKKSSIDESLLKYVSHLAKNWKSKQILYPSNAKDLTERDMLKLREACLYPEFIRLLSLDKSLQSLFFNWTLRDNNGAAQFIEFPSTCLRLHNCILGKRIGRLSPNELNIIQEKTAQGYQKTICLPFYINHEKTRISILDDSVSVTLNDSLTLSIKEICHIFSNKRHKPGNVEFFGTTGIMNWNNFECGSFNPKTGLYNRIDLRERAWWKQLPVLEELSKKQIEEKYQVSLNDGEWVRCISSTRENLNFSATGQHAYLEMAIPIDNNRYAIYPFGKFPKHYPTYMLPQIRLVTQTVLARIAYPDENTFYSHRQHATNPKIKTPEEGMLIMDRIRNDIVKAIHDNLHFQLGYDNCAHWVEETIVNAEGKEAPNPFKIPITQVQLQYKAFDYFIHASQRTQSMILNSLRLFASLDGKKFKENNKIVYKTTAINSNINKFYQYQPIHLNKQIEEGSLPGVITYGN